MWGTASVVPVSAQHVERGARGEEVAAVGRAVIAGEDLLRDVLGTSAAPTGMPDPIALPTVTRSGFQPNDWK